MAADELIALIDAAKMLNTNISAISWNGFNIAGDRKSIDEVYRLMQLENRAKSLDREVLNERERTQRWRQAEQSLSQAYVRLRALIPGAFDTPTAPSPQQVWEVTEQALKTLLAMKGSPSVETLYIVLDGTDSSRHFPKIHGVFHTIEEAKASLPGVDWQPLYANGTIFADGLEYQIVPYEGS